MTARRHTIKTIAARHESEARCEETAGYRCGFVRWSKR
jgi:hypothetical protein